MRRAAPAFRSSRTIEPIFRVVAIAFLAVFMMSLVASVLFGEAIERIVPSLGVHIEQPTQAA